MEFIVEVAAAAELVHQVPRMGEEQLVVQVVQDFNG
jgi:hypothetical protein